MDVVTSIAQDNSLVYSRLLRDLRQHVEIRRMFVWRNGMQQLHFCSQWDEELGVVPDRLDRIRQVALKKRMVVTSIEQTGLQQTTLNQQAAAIYRGFADASVLELHLLLSDDPSEMKQQITKIEQTIQPIADSPVLKGFPDDELPPVKQKPAAKRGRKRLAKKKQPAKKVPSDLIATKLAPPENSPRLSRTAMETQYGLVDFFSNINASLDRNKTAFNVVSELRRETDSDRVSLVAFAQQSKGKLVATSGVAKINRKGRETIQLEQLVNKICRQNLPFSYPSEDFLDIPIKFRSRVESYLTNSSARSLMVIPITLEQSDGPTDTETKPLAEEKAGSSTTPNHRRYRD